MLIYWPFTIHSVKTPSLNVLLMYQKVKSKVKLFHTRHADEDRVCRRAGVDVLSAAARYWTPVV
jgi:hypothetical protein